MVVPNLLYLASSVLALGAIARGAILPQSFSDSPHRTQINVRETIDDVLNQLPAQCQSACDTMLNAKKTCPSLEASCLCTPALDAGIKSCYDCAFSTENNTSPTVISQVQFEFFVFQDACAHEGFAVPSLTLSAASNVPAPTGNISVSDNGGIFTFAGVSSTAGGAAATSSPAPTGSGLPAPSGSPSSSAPTGSGSVAPSGSPSSSAGAPGATSGVGKISAVSGGLLSLVAGLVVLFV